MPPWPTHAKKNIPGPSKHLEAPKYAHTYVHHTHIPTIYKSFRTVGFIK